MQYCIFDRYLRSWFIIDFVASFPIDFFMNLFALSSSAEQANLEDVSRATRFLRIVKILTLVKVARIPR